MFESRNCNVVHVYISYFVHSILLLFMYRQLSHCDHMYFQEVLEDPQVASVKEEQSPEVLVTTVKACDNDLAPNSQLY